MSDRSGQDLGNYRLVRLLGKGGFADVYLGEHRSLNTRAAIKVLNTRLATQEQIDEFSREAYIVARLIHPNIVRVLDFGVEEDVPFLVMDYAPHGTLRQHYPQGTVVPLGPILPYVRQTAAALQYAHDHQLIHRDIKPENLLLGRQGEVWVSDFGIATVAHNTDSLPIQDSLNTVGTVAYMAPEQLRGDPRPASDQYGLAVVVYEWLGGKRPFSGTTLELAFQHQFVPPMPLQRVASAIPAGVSGVVMQALAKDPKERFASVQAFATALELAGEEAAPPRPVSSAMQAAPPISFQTQQDPPELLPTKILPERQSRPPSVVVDAQMDHGALAEGQGAVSKDGQVPIEEQITLPRSGQINQPGPPSARSSEKRLARRTKVGILAAVLLLVLLGAILLVMSSGLLRNALGELHAAAPSSTLAANSSPQTGQTSGVTPHPSPGATGSALPTPVGTTTSPGTSPTPGSSPTPTPLPPQLTVTPLTVNFNLSLVNCLLQSPPQALLTVKNTGASGMNWQASIQNTNYLTISQSSGHLDPGQTTSVTVTLICQQAAVQTTDPITFTSNGGGTVVVNVTITLS